MHSQFLYAMTQDFEKFWFKEGCKSPIKLIQYYDELQKINISDKSNDQSLIQDALIDTIFKYTSLASGLYGSPNSNDEKVILYSGYVTSLVNNLISIRALFLTGMNLQIQPILRMHIEQLKILTAIVYDEELYKRVSTYHEESQKTLTPKQSHVDKVLFKLQKEHNQLVGMWKLINSNIDFLYERLSAVAHGNFLNITFHLMQEEVKDRPLGIGGRQNQDDATNLYVSIGSDLSQLMWPIIRRHLLDQELIYLSNDNYGINQVEPIILRTQ